MGRIAKALVVILLLIGTGCGSYETRMYEGRVVDEAGLPINGVSVTLCYDGWHWDWSMSGGFPLTMGYPYCSDIVTTDQFGNYRILFAGPPSTTIFARHPDWIQTKSFLAKDNRVVLVSRIIDRQRHIKREEEKEKAFRKLKANESAVEYYCRVVLKRSRMIDLDYHGRRVKFIQALLVESNKAILAVSGPYNTVQTMAAELIVGNTGINGVQPMLGNFTVLSGKSNCSNNNIYLISSVYHGGNDLSALYKMERLKIELPSLRAIWPMKVWKLE